MAELLSYENRLKDDYADEVAAAATAGVHGVECPSEAFDMLVAAAERLVFVVTLQRQLIVAAQLKNGFEIRHPVLAGGEDVLAAGELELVHGDGMKIVLEVTNKSGHYEPAADCLETARQVLEELGYIVPPTVIRPYPRSRP